MDIGMMQPSFMPWLGYFELIEKAELFIFLDDFQFSLQSYHQRNRLFVSPGKAGWYTVPVVKAESFKAPLNRVKMNEPLGWREKMWMRIENNYRKARCYREISPLIREWLFHVYGSLAEQNVAFIRLACSLLGMKKEFLFSSQLMAQSRSSERVVEFLRRCGASRYFCANGSFGYMQEEGVFPIPDVEVLFQDFVPAPYAQVGSETFAPFLSAADALLNVGPEETRNLVRNGTQRWLEWNEMAALKIPKKEDSHESFSQRAE